MATTTNYNWSTPDDTSLVKDGAAAIRTLGSSIDTTTKALNPSTTLGDIEYRSSTANTNTRLGIGTTGQVLSVSGGVPAWTSPSSGALTLINTTTFSGVADTGTSFDNVFSSTYTNYYVSFNEVRGVTLAADLHLQLRYAGPTTQTTTYQYRSSKLEGQSPTTQTLLGGSNTSEFMLTDDMGNTGGYGTNGWLEFNKIVPSSRAFINWRFYTESEQTVNGGGYQYTARTYTGFLLKASAGNISGTISVYGLAK